MELTQIREELDIIDKKIVELFIERMAVCENVAKYKIQEGMVVFDEEREKNKISAVRALAEDEFNKQGVQELFGQIMATSRKLQYQILQNHGITDEFQFKAIDALDTLHAKIVFPGAEGAYSEAAMAQYFGKHIESFHVDTFREAMEAIAKEEADFGVIPIENSTAGSVIGNYDLLEEFDNTIVGEQIIKIEHCLLGVEGTDISHIKKVYSHPQSLMQSSRFLNEYSSWQQISMQNNAFAARKVANENDKTQAAIASEHAGQIYGLNILKRGINHSHTNSTRFIIVTKKKIYLKNAKKISICFEADHQSGSLYHMLSHFMFNNLNLTKIESRPIEGRNWEYRFFLDFEGSLEDSAVKNALFGLKSEARNIKILGNY